MNDIARPVGEDSVRKVTNELNLVSEIGCGDSTNSVWSSMYSCAPIGPKPAAAQFIHTERYKFTDGPNETCGRAHGAHLWKGDRALRGFASSNLLELCRGLDPAALT